MPNSMLAGAFKCRDRLDAELRCKTNGLDEASVRMEQLRLSGN